MNKNSDLKSIPMSSIYIPANPGFVFMQVVVYEVGTQP